jgi:hypothetical protein
MKKREVQATSISKATTYKEIGDFWDTHDSADYLEQGKDVKMEFKIDTEVTYYALDNQLSERLLKAAKKHGVSSDTLINMWLQDKLQEENVH